MRVLTGSLSFVFKLYEILLPAVAGQGGRQTMQELDYKAMWEAAVENTRNKYLMHEELCKCMTNVSENMDAATVVAGNLFKMSLPDQLMIIKAASVYTDVGVKLCEKYGFERKQEEDTYEDN